MDFPEGNDVAGSTVSPIEVHLVNGANNAERLERIEEEHDIVRSSLSCSAGCRRANAACSASAC